MGQRRRSNAAAAAGAAAALLPAAAAPAPSSIASQAAAADPTSSPRLCSTPLPSSSFSSSSSSSAAALRPPRAAALVHASSLAGSSVVSRAARPTAAPIAVPLRTAAAAAAFRSADSASLLPTTASSVAFFSCTEEAAAAAGRWRVATGCQLAAAAAAVLVACVAAAAAQAASYESATASAGPSYWPGQGAAATAGEKRLFPPPETGVGSFEIPEVAADAGNPEHISPPVGEEAAAAAKSVQELYRRSGAAAYEWYAPASAQPAAFSADAEYAKKLEMPVLYSVSFLHDFLNYATALLWFAAYTALLWRVCVARNIHGLSLQSLFALVLVETSNVLLVVCLSLYYRKQLHAEFFLIDVSSAAVSVSTFLYVYHFFGSSYEADRDNFGKQLTRFAVLEPYSRKYYFAVLYILSLCLAIPMFLFRRASAPTSSPPSPLSPLSPPAAAAPPPPSPLQTDAAAASASDGFSAVSASHPVEAFSSSVAFPTSLSSSPSLADTARRIFYLLSFWECFNDTVLALALLPQLCMLYNKRPRRVASLLGTFVALLFFARVVAFLYWLTFPLFHNTYPAGRGIHLATEALNILLLSDFLYYYLKARLSGETDITLPL